MLAHGRICVGCLSFATCMFLVCSRVIHNMCVADLPPAVLLPILPFWGSSWDRVGSLVLPVSGILGSFGSDFGFSGKHVRAFNFSLLRLLAYTYNMYACTYGRDARSSFILCVDCHVCSVGSRTYVCFWFALCYMCVLGIPPDIHNMCVAGLYPVRLTSHQHLRSSTHRSSFRLSASPV